MYCILYIYILYYTYIYIYIYSIYTKIILHIYIYYIIYNLFNSTASCKGFLCGARRDICFLLVNFRHVTWKTWTKSDRLQQFWQSLAALLSRFAAPTLLQRTRRF